MTDTEILASLDDRRALALTAWAEARRIPRNSANDHSPVEELIAVMVVVRNRREHFGRWRATDASYKAICLAPRQFSCWNPGSGTNHDRLMEIAGRLALMSDDDLFIGAQLDECLYLADGVIGGEIIDRTNGADSYWAPAAMTPPGRTPSWARQLPQWQIGDQIFVRVG